MAYLVAATDKEGATLYVKTVGRKRVTWTPDREQARRFRQYDGAVKAQQRARDVLPALVVPVHK
jgi:hypothetical protein